MTTLRTLECLVALVEHRSVTRAAASLYMSQPALSHQIASLERELGAPVVERLPRGVRLTAAGRAAAEEAQTAVAAADRAIEVGRRVGRATAGRIRVSCAETMTAWLLVPVLSDWRVHRPDVQLELSEFTSADAATKTLEEGSIDIAIGPRPTNTTAHIKVFGQEAMVVVVAKGHRFEELKDGVPVHALAEEPFVHYDPDNGMAAWVDQFAHHHGVEFKSVLRTRSPRTAAQLAAGGVGATVVPVSALTANAARSRAAHPTDGHPRHRCGGGRAVGQARPGVSRRHRSARSAHLVGPELVSTPDNAHPAFAYVSHDWSRGARGRAGLRRIDQEALRYCERAVRAPTSRSAPSCLPRERGSCAADETRRRIERDLHDGAQQRLVGLALRLRMTSSRVSIDDPVRSDIDALADEVLGIIAELREISSGIHPTVLSRSGLGAAMRMLARRSAVPVYTDIRLTGRLPEAVETCAYYSVSELLTNAAKHAHATLAKVIAAVDGHTLRIYVSDDGIGGVDPRRGSGLTGIKDASRRWGECAFQAMRGEKIV